MIFYLQIIPRARFQYNVDTIDEGRRAKGVARKRRQDPQCW